jgi:hypothetical protein
MSRIWTAQRRAGADPADTLLIADGWRWGAALFPLLWALWGRHWIVAVVVLAVMAAQVDLAMSGQSGAAALLEIGLTLTLGLEGAAAARLDRRIRRWRDLGGVAAESAQAAEARFFIRSAGGAT